MEKGEKSVVIRSAEAASRVSGLKALRSAYAVGMEIQHQEPPQHMGGCLLQSPNSASQASHLCDKCDISMLITSFYML